MYSAAVEQQADIVIGSRMAGEKSEMPKVRRLGNMIFARLVNIVAASNITDSASGQRIFKRSVLEQLYPLPDGLNLTPVMSTRALHERMKMIEVAIPYSERVGRSKLSVVRDGYRFGHSIVWTALNYNPVRPLGLFGLGSLALAAFIGVVLIIARLQGIQSVGAVGAFALFSGPGPGSRRRQHSHPRRQLQLLRGAVPQDSRQARVIWQAHFPRPGTAFRLDWSGGARRLAL